VKKSLALTILRNVCCQLSNPGRGFSSPRRVPQTKKSPYLRTGSHLEYGGEGGIDSLRSPLRGSPLAGSRSVQLAAPVVEPRSGVLIPPAENIKEKSPYLRTGSHLEYGGEGGIDSLRSPLRGSPLAGSRSVQLAAPVVEPRSGVLIPLVSATCKKKARTCVRALLKIWR